MTTQFWKGLLMTVVGVIVAAFSATPQLVLSMTIVTLIGSVLVYFGVNAFKNLRPISIPSTITGRDAVAALLILIGNGVIEAVVMIAGTGKILWPVFFKVVLSITFTYLGGTLFAGPYSTKPVNWSYRARLEYNKK